MDLTTVVNAPKSILRTPISKALLVMYSVSRIVSGSQERSRHALFFGVWFRHCSTVLYNRG